MHLGSTGNGAHIWAKREHYFKDLASYVSSFVGIGDRLGQFSLTKGGECLVTFEEIYATPITRLWISTVDFLNQARHLKEIRLSVYDPTFELIELKVRLNSNEQDYAHAISPSQSKELMLRLLAHKEYSCGEIAVFFPGESAVYPALARVSG
jgi:hypothetical protein